MSNPEIAAAPTDTHSFVLDHDSDAAKKIDVAVMEHLSERKSVQQEQSKQGNEPRDTASPAESSRGPSISTVPDQQSDAGSVHSMPILRISESPTPMSQDLHSPLPSPAPSMISRQGPPPSPARSHTLQERSSSSNLSRNAARHRSITESRSTNRLSGFFNNLMSRRDPTIASSIQEDQDLPTSPSQVAHPSNNPSDSGSRAASPPPTRPVTPPPALPPPSLNELGLSLSTLTSDLSPSHFSTPPTSGAFLPPHYLLLCHPHGLDVLPLISPPAPQPYALIRRVNFKSVVVMEHRGVLVAIAGRRDGVRVYALEEVKRAIEWRIDVEIKRERDKQRRETLKKPPARSVDTNDMRDSTEKKRKASLSTPPPGEDNGFRSNLLRKASLGGAVPLAPSPPPMPLIPRSPVSRPPGRKARSSSVNNQAQPPPPALSTRPPPSGRPPPYMLVDESNSHMRHQPSVVSLRARSRSGSVNAVLSGSVQRRGETSRPIDEDIKADWAESSEEEAIDIVAAGASGSQALDERTSATLAASRASSASPLVPPVVSTSSPVHTRSRSGTLRRNRPSDLDLTLARPTSNSNSNTIPPPEPSPAPTLLSLRQALSQTSLNGRPAGNDPNTQVIDDDDDDMDPRDGTISLTQILMESRLPDLPPVGSTRPQQAILLGSTNPSHLQPPPESNRLVSIASTQLEQSNNSNTNSRRRRRPWSMMMPRSSSQSQARSENASVTPPLPNTLTPPPFLRSNSQNSNPSPQPSDTLSSSFRSPSSTLTVSPNPTDTSPSPGTISTRFLPRLFNRPRRSEDQNPPAGVMSDSESLRTTSTLPTSQLPPPKLEYVKLPGTKNALLIKAVETARKSFLAILCGENGERVELFAGTYRTALGLSRTFILPDSPRSLELQLQGDDLVEVFLVFAQNVFGLEPATVRVREVRIGRAERRAARRRARENRNAESQTQLDQDNQDDDVNLNISIGVSASVGNNVVATGDGPELIAAEHPSDFPSTPADPTPTTSIAQPDELLALAASQMGPYTTFQQLMFAPKFPLASIADEYIIPPTYPSFMEYRKEHEPENETGAQSVTEPAPAPSQFNSPPGLPVPMPTAPPKWLYRDPKGVVHGPWKTSLMQAWYKDGLLPADLPVKREEDEDYILLKELRQQCVDPTQPFRSPPIRVPSPPPPPPPEAPKPLLPPISLLAQPRHFGPPALFFSSRGGHSTNIVDSRGRSVLKGRFMWSSDETAEETGLARMGDVRRLEAFDVDNRSVLVAMRQGGLEAVELGDALLKPADESRTVLPHYSPPVNNINRRPPFVWRIGTPITNSSTPFSALTNKSKMGAFSNLASRKPSTGNRSATTGGFHDLSDPGDELFFIGRRGEEIYFCERNAGSFRVLKLAPTSSS